jgi:hypothetical protein
MSGAKAKFARRVAVAVLVLDDFTDRVLSGLAIQVSVPGMVGKPIRKSDGYFVPPNQCVLRNINYYYDTISVIIQYICRSIYQYINVLIKHTP